MAEVGQPKLAFPAYILDLRSRETYVAQNTHELETYLEFHDSSDPEDAGLLRVLDAGGRRVNVLVDRLEAKRLELEVVEPLAEDLELLSSFRRLN